MTTKKTIKGRARAWQYFGQGVHIWSEIPPETERLIPSEDGESVFLARANGETFGEAWGLETTCEPGDECDERRPCDGIDACAHHLREASACDPMNDPSAELHEVVYVEHPEFGTVPTVGGRVCADFIAEAKDMGIDVPEVLP